MLAPAPPSLVADPTHEGRIESLEVLDARHLLIANDNNYPGSDGRWIARDRPDDTELIVVRAPALR
jgi:hypothetical protein